MFRFSKEEKVIINKFKDIKKKYPLYYRIAISVFILLLLMPLIITGCYCLGEKYKPLIVIPLSLSNSLSISFSLLAFIGTIVLGFLALWQNHSLKESNDASQAKLFDLSEKANNLSLKLVRIESDRFRPYIKIMNKDIKFAVGSHTTEFLSYIKRNCVISFSGNSDQYKNNNSDCIESLFLAFDVMNIGGSTIANIHIQKAIISDGVTGGVVDIIPVSDSFIMQGEQKKLGLVVSVPRDNENKSNFFDNPIKNFYAQNMIESFNVNLNLFYCDIFGRNYTQSYNITIKPGLNINMSISDYHLFNVQAIVTHEID